MRNSACIRARKKLRNRNERVRQVNASRQKSYYSAHPDYAEAQREKDRQRKAARRLPFIEDQDGLCGCGEPLDGEAFLDHDHSCCDGRPTESCGSCDRGVLHRNCNMILGMIEDSPKRLRALADYLDRTTRYLESA